MSKKFISLFIALIVFALLVVPASAHYVTIFPGSSQAESVNVTAENFYFNKGDSTNLYLYIIHPADSNFAAIGEAFQINMTLIAPNGSETPVSLARSPETVSYDIGNGSVVRTNWYSGTVTLSQDGVYYVKGSQKGFDENGVLTRERYTVAPLFVGNSSTGWDNIQKIGHNAGIPVTIFPTSNPKNMTASNSLVFSVDGNLSWFENEAENPTPIKNPFPIRAESYVSPFEMKANGPSEGIYTHLNSNMTKAIQFGHAGVWSVVTLNQDLGEDRDNYQTVYMLPVLSTAGNNSGGDTDGDSSIPGIGILGVIACIGIVAGALFMRRK